MSLKKFLPLLLLAPLVILIDQLTKIWVVNNLVIGQTVNALDALYPYLRITRTTNTGIAFGMASGGNTIILVLSVIITIGLLWMYLSTRPSEMWQRVGFAIVMGGAIGNIIDRIRFGHVVDFFHVTIPGYIENVSNFADHFVIIGVVVLLIDSFMNSDDSQPDETIDAQEVSSAD